MEAFSMFPVISRTPYKITSLVSGAHNIFVGNGEGRIMVFSLDRKHSAPNDLFESKEKKPELSSLSLRFEREVETGGKGKVKRMAVLHAADLLLSLCDGILECWSMHTMLPAASFPLPSQDRGHVKGFCVNVVRDVQEVLIIGKKALYQYAYISDQWAWKQTFPVTDATEVAFSLHTAAIATKKEYTLMDTRNGAFTELFPHGGSPGLLATPESEYIFTQDRLGLCVNSSGVVTRANYTFQGTPVNLCHAKPYLIALMADSVHVMDQQSGNLAQVVQLKGATNIHAGKNFVFVYSKDFIIALRPLPIVLQVTNFIKAGNAKMGLDLYMQTSRQDPDFKDNLKSFYQLAGDESFKRCNFEQAFKFYQNSNVDPRKILTFFPFLSTQSNQEMSLSTIVPRALAADSKRARRILPTSDPKVLYRVATEQLVEYSRFAMGRFRSDESLKPILNNAIALLLAQLSPNDFKKHLSEMKSDLNFDKLERSLTQMNCWSSLGQLYDFDHRTSKALELWYRMAVGEIKDVMSDSNPMNDIVRSLSESTDFELLQHYTPLVWEHSKPNLRLVYMNPSRSQNVLPHAEVAEYLAQFEGMELAYLEFLVSSLGSREKPVHIKLSALHLQKVLQLVQKATPEEIKEVSRALASEMIDQGVATRRSRSSRRMNVKASNPLLESRRKFIAFLRSSHLYDPRPILLHIESSPLLEEKILVYTQLGQYNKALNIILNEMNDEARAEKFCLSWKPNYKARVDDPKFDSNTLNILNRYSATDANPLLQSLFNIFVSTSTDPLPAKALRLIEKYPSKLDPLQVVKNLPSSVPLKLISAYLMHALKQTSSRLKQTQVARNVESSQAMKKQIALLRQQKHHSVVSRDTVCPVTGSKLVKNSAFLRFPNGVVTAALPPSELPRHICPVTGRNFKDEPMDQQ
eukprot:TRINITY_DN5578_c0_g1_i1.p1 TRINITY_DN5578_c0_g1~~TRINITY_DN5578_c0_g1_i1.p1  ORF type:complete len:959 (+),score=183.30 TRINITY_DN5578_c0_g1_i1:124-2877(+)